MHGRRLPAKPKPFRQRWGGDADPEKRAAIRDPSIRGELRRRPRDLGGFKLLAFMPVRGREP